MNTYTNLRYHLILRTLDDTSLLKGTQASALSEYVHALVRNENGMLIDTAVMPDHVHLLLGVHQSIALADMVRKVKAISSKWLNERYGQRGWFRWSPGYGAFSVGHSQVENVRRFFSRQQHFHEEKTLEQEFVQFVEKHGLKYEKRPRAYVWSRLHVVFATKLRMALIPEAAQSGLFQHMGELAAEQRTELVDAGGVEDHVHLVLAPGRTVSLADVMQSVKGTSTPWVRDHLGDESFFAWQRGYGAFTVSLSELPRVRAYVQNQREHHHEISFHDELRSLLVEHGLDLQADEHGPP